MLALLAKVANEVCYSEQHCEKLGGTWLPFMEMGVSAPLFSVPNPVHVGIACIGGERSSLQYLSFFVSHGKQPIPTKAGRFTIHQHSIIEILFNFRHIGTDSLVIFRFFVAYLLSMLKCLLIRLARGRMTA